MNRVVRCKPRSKRRSSAERSQTTRTNALPDLRPLDRNLGANIVALLATQALASLLHVRAPADVLRNLLESRDHKAVAVVAHDVDGATALREKCQRPDRRGMFRWHDAITRNAGGRGIAAGAAR